MLEIVQMVITWDQNMKWVMLDHTLVTNFQEASMNLIKGPLRTNYCCLITVLLITVKYCLDLSNATFTCERNQW